MSILRSIVKWGAIVLLCSFAALCAIGIFLKPKFYDVKGQQESLYKPDTAGFYVNRIAGNLGIDAPVFVFDSRDSNRYRDDLNIQGEAASGALGASWDAVVTIEQARQKREQATNGKVIAYSVRLPRTNACALVFTEHFEDNSVLFKSSVVIHELTHCGQQYYLKNDPEKQGEIQDVVEKIGGSLPYGIVDTVYAESLPTAMQWALSFDKDDIGEAFKYGFGYEYSDAQANKRWVEAPNVALVMPKVCPKAGDCPTNLLLLQEKLVKDARYVTALRADMERWNRLNMGTDGRIASSK